MVIKKKSGKNTKKQSLRLQQSLKKKIKKQDDGSAYSGIVIVDDDLTIDKEAELEERRAFLEEARSQEASSD